MCFAKKIIQIKKNDFQNFNLKAKRKGFQTWKLF